MILAARLLLLLLIASTTRANPPAVASTSVPAPTPTPTPVATALSVTAQPVPSPSPAANPDCRPQDQARMDSLTTWQRPLYREAALKAANGGKFDVELEDRFRLMTSDALYGRPGAILARRNDTLLQQYARELEKLGLQIDSASARKIVTAWNKALRPKEKAAGKFTWLPVKSFARVMTGPELFRRCGHDLLDAQVVVTTDSQLGAVGMVCPGILLRLGALRWGPEVRAPVQDTALGVTGDPNADREPLVVNLPDHELTGLLLDLAVRAMGSGEPARRRQVTVLENLAKQRKFKKPADRDAWLRANRRSRCLLAP